MVKPRWVTVDEEERLPPAVVERFMEDNIPPADVDEVGYVKAVILDATEPAVDIPNGTFIARLPEGF